MAQDFVKVLICDGCKILRNERITEDVATIGVPGTHVELEACGDCRMRFEPLFTVIAKQGRIPDREKVRGRRPAAAITVAPARARPAEPPAELALMPAPKPAEANGDAWVPGRLEDQVWDLAAHSYPTDLVCRTCKPPTQQKSKLSFGLHLNNSHPEKLVLCVTCGKRTASPYQHYVDRHPEVKMPPGAWRAR